MNCDEALTARSGSEISSTTAIVSAFQNTEKLPATRPDRMVSEAPPSRERGHDLATWRECELVNTLVSSGISAAASVPHEMMVESFHHRPVGRGRASIQPFDAAKVTTIDSSEVSHTRLVSGASKSILSLPLFCAARDRARSPR